MKWINEPGEPLQMLALRTDEAKQVSQLLGTIRKDIERKYEKYKDLHESGEATERQQNLMFEYEEKLTLIDRFIKTAAIAK